MYLLWMSHTTIWIIYEQSTFIILLRIFYRNKYLKQIVLNLSRIGRILTFIILDISFHINANTDI